MCGVCVCVVVAVAVSNDFLNYLDSQMKSGSRQESRLANEENTMLPSRAGRVHLLYLENQQSIYQSMISLLAD